MIDPTLKLREGVITAVDAAMTANSKTCPIYANPQHGQSLPYISMPDVLTLPRHNKTHEGTEAYHTFNVHANDPDEAYTLADIVLQALTDRASAITVDASVKLITYELDNITGPIEIDTPDGREFGISLRIQYRTHE